MKKARRSWQTRILCGNKSYRDSVELGIKATGSLHRKQDIYLTMMGKYGQTPLMARILAAKNDSLKTSCVILLFPPLKPSFAMLGGSGAGL